MFSQFSLAKCCWQLRCGRCVLALKFNSSKFYINALHAPFQTDKHSENKQLNLITQIEGIRWIVQTASWSEYTIAGRRCIQLYVRQNPVPRAFIRGLTRSSLYLRHRSPNNLKCRRPTEVVVIQHCITRHKQLLSALQRKRQTNRSARKPQNKEQPRGMPVVRTHVNTAG